MILGIETATPICSVGLAEGERVIAEVSFDVKNLHDRVLAEAIQQMLRWCAVSLSEIEAFAVSAGPGSFTGLRLGMGVVKGLAFAQKKPVIAVSTLLLQAVAAASHARAFARGRAIEASAVRLVPVLQSRRGEIYTATYALQEAPLPAQIASERAMAIADFSAAGEGVSVFCGNGVAALREAGAFNTNRSIVALDGQEARLSGGWAARAGGIKYRRGEYIDAEELEPIYLQDFVTVAKAPI